jgi:AcrR family transcriptional regulator
MTCGVVNYTRRMSRWEPGSAERLRAAALELFVEHGFAAVTVPEITARAGLTTRTFFRHFADKREVLFAGEDELPAVVTRVFTDAPPSLAPMEVIVKGLTEVVAPRFEGLRDYLRVRRGVIESDEGLRERELRKLAVIAEGGAAGFRGRGLSEVEASLAADLAVAVFRNSVTRWLDDPEDRGLATVVTETAAVLASLVRS